MATWKGPWLSLPEVEPKFSKDNPEAAVRDGAEELTLRRGEAGGLRTLNDPTNVGDSRYGPLLVEEGLACSLPGHLQRNRVVRSGKCCTKSMCMPRNNRKATTLWM